VIAGEVRVDYEIKICEGNQPVKVLPVASIEFDVRLFDSSGHDEMLKAEWLVLSMMGSNEMATQKISKKTTFNRVHVRANEQRENVFEMLWT
jgi:hypothetical protein